MAKFTKADKQQVFKAIERSDTAALTELLDAHPEALEATGEHNSYVRDKTPLMFALQCDNLELARLLLARGANAKAKMSGGPRDSVLFLCCSFASSCGVIKSAAADAKFRDWVALAGELLDRGANPNDGLSCACSGCRVGRNESPDLIRTLLERGADPDRKLNRSGDTTRKLVEINARLYPPEALALFGLQAPAPQPAPAGDAQVAAPPLMEHPSEDFSSARDAMADAVRRLQALPEWTDWITFTAQGMGGRVDSYHCAEIQMRRSELKFAKPIDLDVALVTQSAEAPPSSLAKQGDVYTLEATPEETARLLDVIFRTYLGIRPHTGEENDYGIAAEW